MNSVKSLELGSSCRRINHQIRRGISPLWSPDHGGGGFAADEGVLGGGGLHLGRPEMTTDSITQDNSFSRCAWFTKTVATIDWLVLN